MLKRIKILTKMPNQEMFDIIFKNNKEELVLDYKNLEIIYNGKVYTENSFNDIGVYIIKK